MNNLRKSISKHEIFSISLGSIIGWGAFVLPGNKFLPEYGVLNTLIGFIIAVLMIIIIEKNYAVLINRFPRAGGEFTYVTNILSKNLGFITGWFLLLAYISIIPLNATAVPLVLERILGYEHFVFLYSIDGFDVYLSDVIISSSIVLLFGILNIYGFNNSKKIQKYIVYIFVFSILMLFITSLFKLQQSEVYKSNLISNLKDLDFSLIVRVMAFAPWAFVGFDNIPQMTEEIKFDKNKISRIAVISIILGALSYNLLNFITAVGVDKLDLQKPWPTGLASYMFLGKIGLFVIGIALFGAVLSGLNGFFMSSSRLVYAMSRELKPSSNLSKISKMKVPKNSIILITIISFFVPFMGREALFWFVDLSSVGASVAYMLTSLSAFKLSKKNTKNRILSILGIISSALFLVFLLTPFWKSNIGKISGIILVLWIIVGSVLKYMNKRTKS